MLSIDEYYEFRKSIRVLRWVAQELEDIIIYGKIGCFEDIYFYDLQKSLDELEKYPPLPDLEEFSSLKDAVTLALHPLSLSHKISGKNKEIAAKSILENVKPVILKAKEVSEKIKPPRVFAEKSLIEETVRKILGQEEYLDKDLKECNFRLSKYSSYWDNEWEGKFNVHRIKLLELLNELKSIDPFIRCEDEFAYAYDSLSNLILLSLDPKEKMREQELASAEFI